MTLLLLGGTGLADRIAEALSERGHPSILSIAHHPRGGQSAPLPLRVGGFGGEAGFQDFLDAEDISAVLDATHPFAHRISHRTARICAARGLPYAQVIRPEWVPEEGDRWTMLAREEEAADHIAPGSVVFLATGRQTLERFANLEGRRLICRQIDPPDAPFPLPDGEYLVGTPPFSVAEEEALFRELGVDWLVVKNAGGEAPRSKLVAARNLGLPVAMITRPVAPEGPCFDTVDAALAWVDKL